MVISCHAKANQTKTKVEVPIKIVTSAFTIQIKPDHALSFMSCTNEKLTSSERSICFCCYRTICWFSDRQSSSWISSSTALLRCSFDPNFNNKKIMLISEINLRMISIMTRTKILKLKTDQVYVTPLLDEGMEAHKSMTTNIQGMKQVLAYFLVKRPCQFT